jgi:hypothetical protein
MVRRPLLPSVAFGVVVGIALAAAAVGVVALPLFFLARALEPGKGLGRPLVRTGLLQVAVPAGILVGLAAGSFAGRWYHRGGELPREEGERWGG